MKYNRKEIMSRAWAFFRTYNAKSEQRDIDRANGSPLGAFSKITFSHALKRIWENAKHEFAKAEAEKAKREEYERAMAEHALWVRAREERVAALTGEVRERLNALESAKFLLSMKDRWNSDDYCEDSRLHRAIEEIKNAA